jgi:hypothetical protein
MSFGHRLLLLLPRFKHDPDKAPLRDRLSSAFLKPVDPDAPAKSKAEKPMTLEELEVAAKYGNDKERLMGLLLAPISAIIGILVTNDLIVHDPAVGSKQHVNVSVYHELTLVLLALSVAMLVTAWFRKRMYLGIVMALYGLAIFNLHYWGFGIPYILIAAWLLVRAYRLQKELKEATGDTPRRYGGGGAPGAPRAQANKRYTPRSPTTRRPPRPKPENEKRAG